MANIEPEMRKCHGLVVFSVADIESRNKQFLLCVHDPINQTFLCRTLTHRNTGKAVSWSQKHLRVQSTDLNLKNSWRKSFLWEDHRKEKLWTKWPNLSVILFTFFFIYFLLNALVILLSKITAMFSSIYFKQILLFSTSFCCCCWIIQNF